MNIVEDVSLANYTTLKVGGPARYFAEVTSAEQIAQAVTFARNAQVPILVIGEGSNILARDAGFDGLVLHNRITGSTTSEPDEHTVLLTAGAGEVFDAVVATTVAQGVWGLENLSHIPGTVGATPVQNVGAYGVEVSDAIVSVAAINLATAEEKTFTNQECLFGYRDSFFKTSLGKEWCIVSVTFSLSRTPQPKLTYKDLAALTGASGMVTQSDIRQTVIDIRSKKFPDWTTVGTAGSFFKNPIIDKEQADSLLQQYPELPTYPVTTNQVKVSLGYILDKLCGLKGYTQNEVALFSEQAMVLVNHGQSETAISDFAADIASKVHKKTGIIIEQEVTTV